MKNLRLSFCFIMLFALLDQQLYACNVPVFRYALERWPADIYEVYVFHKGAISGNDASVAEWLKENSGSKVYSSNFAVATVDVESIQSDEIREIWKSLNAPPLPRIAVMYPRSTGITKVIWQGELTENNAKMIADSPARQEVAKKLLGGNAGVWVLLESGNAADDAAAADSVEINLKKVSAELQESGQMMFMSDFGEKIEIRFSTLRVSRSDPMESVFISMLMESEPDLKEYASYPMVFPMYGRGRILFALVGKGIAEQNIYRSCYFLLGPCSCEIKAWNPGLDILMCVDWDAGISESWVANQEMAAYMGNPGMQQSVQNPAPNVTKSFSSPDSTIGSPSSRTGGKDTSSTSILAYANPVQPPQAAGTFAGAVKTAPSSSLFRNMFITFGIVFLIVAIIGIRIGLKRKTE